MDVGGFEPPLTGLEPVVLSQVILNIREKFMKKKLNIIVFSFRIYRKLKMNVSAVKKIVIMDNIRVNRLR